MAIGTNDFIHKFGTQDDLSNTTSTVADGAFSDGTNDLSAWTNDDDAPEAVITFSWSYSSGTLDGDPYVAIYARLIDIDGTGDTSVPDASHQHIFLGVLNLDTGLASSTTDYASTVIPLPNVETSQVYNFYIENQTGVTIAASWAFKVTPRTMGPHA